MDGENQAQVWFALLGWYAIKSSALHQRAGGR